MTRPAEEIAKDHLYGARQRIEQGEVTDAAFCIPRRIQRRLGKEALVELFRTYEANYGATITGQFDHNPFFLVPDKQTA